MLELTQGTFVRFTSKANEGMYLNYFNEVLNPIEV